MSAFRGLLVFAAFLLSDVYAATLCGKGNLKVNYGQNKVLAVPRITSGSCRYRIRAPKGLNVQLLFVDFNVEPTNFNVYDADVRPFRWSNAKKLPLTETSSAAGTILSFDTSVIAIKVDASERESPISFSYSAAIPSGGSFGYDFEAKRKRTTIRTPGFPKTLLPTGVRSRWYIHTPSSSAITISFRSLRTASQDYVEVYDGDTRLGRHSGKMSKKSPISYDALSGNLTLYLHTETARTRGFKAVVQLTDRVMPVETDSVSGGEGPSSLLRCHQRTKLSSGGVLITDQKSEMTCDEGQVCATILLKGISSSFGITQAVEGEFMTCVPEVQCRSDLCDAMSPPSIELQSKSCEASCCSTNMCNASPDGPESPQPPSSSGGSSRPVWPFTHENELDCYQSSELISENSVGMGSAGGDRCKEGEICALYVFEGTEKGSGSFSGGGPVHGYSARCAAESECTSEACQSIPDAEYATITSCNVTCCNTHRCNNPDLRPTRPPKPTPPPPSPEPPLRCYDMMIVPRGPGAQGYYLNNKNVVTCEAYSKCARIDVVTLGPSGETRVSTGRCVPAFQCDSLDCDAMQQDLAEVKSCLASCCDTDLCNDQQVVRPAGAGLRCHHRTDFTQEGAVQLGQPPENSYCSAGEVCVAAVYYGTIRDEYNNIDEPIAGQFAGCLPRSSCDSNTTCANFPQARDANADVTQCTLTCCGSDMCNKPIDTPMPSPYPGPFLTCYDIMSSRSGAVQPLNRKKVKTCERFSKCVRIDAVMTDGSGSEVLAAFGDCMPDYQCDRLDCSLLGGTLQGLTLSSCNASCCDSDLCNGNELPAVPETPVVPAGLRCHQKSESVREGAVGLGSSEPSITCPAGEVCGLFIYHGTMYGGTEAVAGQTAGCVAQTACTNDGCAGLPDGANMDITSCKVTCCNSDMCNQPVDTPMPSPSETPAALRCYDILISRAGAMNVLNKKEVVTCTGISSRCLRLDASGKDPYGNTIYTSYGACAPAGTCAQLDCELLQSTTAGFNMESCRTKCCTGDLCNGEELTAADERYSTSLSSPSPSPGSEAPGIQCYQLLEIRGMGMVLPGSEKSPRTCKPGWQCLRVDAAASHQSFPSMQMNVAYGTCIPTCSNENACDSIPTASAGVTINSCEVSCCDTDLCNDSP